MRILMLGWEFPPYISGGLGTACRGLTDAMRRLQARILFVLPKAIESQEQIDSKEEVESPEWTLRRDDTSRVPGEPAEQMEVATVQSEITNPYGTTPPQPVNTVARTSEKKKNTAEVLSRMPNASSVRVLGVGAEDGYDGDLMGKIRAYADRFQPPSRSRDFPVDHSSHTYTPPNSTARVSTSIDPFSRSNDTACIPPQ